MQRLLFIRSIYSLHIHLLQLNFKNYIKLKNIIGFKSHSVWFKVTFDNTSQKKFNQTLIYVGFLVNESLFNFYHFLSILRSLLNKNNKNKYLLFFMMRFVNQNIIWT